jgi:uncharacterized ParB-like nuclease family protein
MVCKDMSTSRTHVTVVPTMIDVISYVGHRITTTLGLEAVCVGVVEPLDVLTVKGVDGSPERYTTSMPLEFRPEISEPLFSCIVNANMP